MFVTACSVYLMMGFSYGNLALSLKVLCFFFFNAAPETELQIQVSKAGTTMGTFYAIHSTSTGLGNCKPILINKSLFSCVGPLLEDDVLGEKKRVKRLSVSIS